MSELRYNLITCDWVIQAPERAKRPHDFTRSHQAREIPERVDTCPFCPGNEATAGEEVLRIGKEHWDVRVLPNKYSSLAPGGDMVRSGGFYDRSMAGLGQHDVIIETPLHNRSLATLPEEHVAKVLTAWRQRMATFYADPVIEHVILFKNHGQAAGSSLEHPHSQIIGVPVLPGQIRLRLEEMVRFWGDFGECVFCHCLRFERDDGRRIVVENDHFVAFLPFAALSPFHLWIFPKRHWAYFGDVPDEEIASLASILKDVLGRLATGLDNPDFNLVIRSLAPAEGDVRYAHWYLSIVPRLAKAAGFELGTGMFINPSRPEDSAAFLRDVAP